MLSDLKRFDITKKQLKNLNPKLHIHVKFKYPAIEFKNEKPKNRIALSRKKIHEYFLDFKSKYKSCKRRGKKKNIYGAEVCIKYEQLKELKKIKYIDWIIVKDIEGFKKKKTKIAPTYFAVLVRIIIHVEKIKKSKLTNELRIYLVKAKSETKAKKKVKKGFEKYETPYLNPYGRIVEWKFEEILDCHENCLSRPAELNDKHGIEVYSKLFNNQKAFKPILKAFQK